MFALKHILGNQKVKNYDGSWIEWSTQYAEKQDYISQLSSDKENAELFDKLKQEQAQQATEEEVTEAKDPLAHLKDLSETELREKRRNLRREHRNLLTKDESALTADERHILEEMKECERLWKIVCL